MRPMLVVMRLAQMRRVHPKQVEMTCARCGETVGVYPSGQSALKADPTLEVVCSECAEREPIPVNTMVALAPGAEREPLESVWREPK